MSSEDLLKHNSKRGIAYNWVGLLLIMFLLFFCLFYALPAAMSGNPLFASGAILNKPAQVVIYYDGETHAYEQNDPEYDVIVDAAYETLRNETGFHEGFGWSDARFDEARAEGIAVEFLYTEPVKIPGRRLDIADPTRLFFPLYVFGHEGEMVFRGGRQEYWGLPIRVDTLDRLRNAVNEVIEEPSS